MVPQLYRLLNFCVFQLLNRFHEAGTNPFECVSMFESRSRWRKNQIIIIAREAGNLLCDDVKFLWHTRTKKAQKQKKNGKARKTKQNTKQMYLELKSIDYLELSGQEIRTRCVCTFPAIGLRFWARVNSFRFGVIAFCTIFRWKSRPHFSAWQHSISRRTHSRSTN